MPRSMRRGAIGLRLWLAPAFGAAMALSFLAGWLALERAISVRIVIAVVLLWAAGAASAAAALLFSAHRPERPWTARLAASLVILIAGTGGLTSLGLAIRIWIGMPDLPELPWHIVLLILANVGAAALYGFLATAGLLMLPAGLPAILLFALLITRYRN